MPRIGAGPSNVSRSVTSQGHGSAFGYLVPPAETGGTAQWGAVPPPADEEVTGFAAEVTRARVRRMAKLGGDGNGS